MLRGEIHVPEKRREKTEDGSLHLQVRVPGHFLIGGLGPFLGLGANMDVSSALGLQMVLAASLAEVDGPRRAGSRGRRPQSLCAATLLSSRLTSGWNVRGTPDPPRRRHWKVKANQERMTKRGHGG